MSAVLFKPGDIVEAIGNLWKVIPPPTQDEHGLDPNKVWFHIYKDLKGNGYYEPNYAYWISKYRCKLYKRNITKSYQPSWL